MKNKKIQLFFAALLMLISFSANSQKVIENFRYDTTRAYNTIVNKNDSILRKTGRGRGKGDKQYERWKWENKFHLQSNGTLYPETYDNTQYAAYGGSVPLSDQWEELGPKEWNRTTAWNPGIGRITAISVYNQNPNIIYVTSPGGGVWKTMDEGATWIPLTDNNGAWLNMFSVAVDQQNPNIVYAGSNAAQLIKSVNGGSTWESVGRLMSGTVNKILIHPSNSSILFAVAQNGIFKSTDAGVNWTKTYTNSVEDIEFKPGDPNIMYATSVFSPSVLRSIDGGLTWIGLTANEGITHAARALVAVSPADPNKVYIVQAFGNEFGRLYVSNNSGQSFSVAVSGSASACTNYFGYETSGCGTGGQAGYDMAIAVNPSNANDVYIGGVNIWRSTNGGTSFTAQTQWSLPLSGSFGYVHADIHALEFSNGILYSGSDGGIYKRGTTTWQDLSKGLGIRQFYRVSVRNGDFIGGAQDNGTSVYTYRWNDWLGADGMDNTFISGSTIIGTSQYGQLYRSTDTGKTYSSLSKPSNGDWVTPLTNDNGVLYAGWTGLYKSVDGGVTWSKLPLNITTTLSCIAASGNYIYASRSTSLYVSVDGGSTWVTYVLPSTINDIQISPSAPTELYLVMNSTTYRVYKSTTAGASWIDISSGLPSIIGRSLAMRNDTLYLGMNIGTYRYTSAAWINITSNLPLSAVNDLELDGQYLYAATYGRGLWRIPVTTENNVTISPELSAISLTGSGNQTLTHNFNWNFTTNQSTISAKLMQSINGGSYSQIYESTGTTGSYTATSRLTSTNYSYRVDVTTEDLSGNSSVVNLSGPPAVEYTISTILLSGNRNNKNVHTINWSFTTNDAIQSVKVLQSTDGVNYSVINTSVNAVGSLSTQTAASTTYRYRVDVVTTNKTASSSVITINNPKKGRQ